MKRSSGIIARVLLLIILVCAVGPVLYTVGHGAERPHVRSVYTSGSLQYGQALGTLGLHGTFENSAEDEIPGRLEWVRPAEKLPAGEHRAAYRFVPANEEQYVVLEGNVSVEVAPLTLEVYAGDAQPREYNGERTAQALDVLFVGEVAGDEVDVLCTVYYADAAPGLNKPVEKVETEITGRDRANYTAEIAGQPAAGRIDPFSGAQCPGATVRVEERAGGGHEWDLSTLLPLQGPGEPGIVRFSGPESIVGDSDIFREPPALTGDRLQVKLEQGIEAGKSVSMRFTAHSAHYAPVEAVLTLEVAAVREVTGVRAPNKVYDAAAYRPEGAPTAGGDAVEQPVYRYTGRGGTAYDSAAPPVAAGSYRLEVSAPGESDTRPQVLEFEIFRAPLRILPEDVEIIAGAPLPTAYSLQFHTLLGADTAAVLTPQPEVAADVASSAEPGVYTLRVRGAPKADNYDVVTETGNLVIRARAGEERYYNAPAPGPGGWYRAPITVEPGMPGLYNEIALSSQGPFGPEVTVDREGVHAAKLYVRGSGGAVGDILFPYKLDQTAPSISGVVCDPATGVVTVGAEDALSGIAGIRLFGPGSGAEIAAKNGVLTVAVSGQYTVEVGDVAGNTASATYTLQRNTENADGSGNNGDNSSGQNSTGSSSTKGSGGSYAGSGSDQRDGEAVDFWDAVSASIRAAKPGATVRVMCATRGRIPVAVLHALRDSGATLRLIRNEGEVLLPGGRIPSIPPEAVSYTVEEVLAMLLDAQEEDDLPNGPPTYLAGSESAPVTRAAAGQVSSQHSAEPPEAAEIEQEPPEEEPEPAMQPTEAAVEEVFPAQAAGQELLTESIPTTQTPRAVETPTVVWVLAGVLAAGALGLAALAFKMHLSS